MISQLLIGLLGDDSISGEEEISFRGKFVLNTFQFGETLTHRH